MSVPVPTGHMLDHPKVFIPFTRDRSIPLAELTSREPGHADSALVDDTEICPPDPFLAASSMFAFSLGGVSKLRLRCWRKLRISVDFRP